MVMCIGCNVVNTEKKKLVLLHTVSEMRQTDNSKGQSCETLFVNADYCEEITGLKFENVKPETYVGKELFVSRNRKGFVDSIEIIEERG